MTAPASLSALQRIPEVGEPVASPAPPSTPQSYLNALLARTLRVTTKDGRFFVGELECTDRDANIILAGTTEYRAATAGEVKSMMENFQITGRRVDGLEIDAASQKIRVDCKSRRLGLVVVPGKHIVKIEVEG